MALIEAVPFRPFSKVVTFTSTAQTSTITLTDTSGTPILCNYIQASIAAPFTSAASYVMVTPSGISSNPAVALGNGASGTLGLIGTLLDPAEVLLGGSDYCSAISLYSSSAITAIVTYGVRVQPNPMKALQKNRGV